MRGSNMISSQQKTNLLAPRTRQLRWYLLVLSCLGAITYIFLSSGSYFSSSNMTMQQSGIGLSRKVTIVMNTFKRHEQMSEGVSFYSKCDLVENIHVIWSEKNSPPEEIRKKFATQAHPQVFFDIQDVDSLNSRFKPLTGPHTDAIFTVDDDMRVSCKDLGLGYEVWLNSQRTLVGYMPRLHLRQSDGKSWRYRCWWRVWWHGTYSIMLTKAAFLHHDYFNLYTNVMPQSIRDLVDKGRNCEDIAMQFLIANTTSLPPIYVRGNLGDLGAFPTNNGISAKNFVAAQHMDARSNCINNLVQIYGHNPLVKSHIIVNSAGNGWTNAPSTWYEYISSDLWAFR